MKNIYLKIVITFLILTPGYIYSQDFRPNTDGLVLYLKSTSFIEKSQWTDYSKYDNNGIVDKKSKQGYKYSYEGNFNYLPFDGIKDFVSFNNSNSLNPNSGLTIIVWVRLNTFSQNQTIISKGFTSNQLPFIQYSLKMSDSPPFDVPQFGLSLNGELKTLNADTKLTEKKWYMISCTYDRNLMKLFVNNIQDKNIVENTSEISMYDSNLEIGRWGPGKSQYLSGDIGGVLVYNRSLSDVELDYIWNETRLEYGYTQSDEKKIFSSNSRIKLPDGKYIDGRYYEGDFTFYSKFGKPDSTTLKRNGKGVTFWKNSDVMMERGVYKNNLLDGFGETFREDGSKQYEGNWKEGKLNGIGKSFYSNGKVYYEGEFKNDLANGIGKIYNQNGHLYFEGEYVNGEIFGKGKIFYESGQVYQEGEFRYGKANGIGKIFNLDGTTNFEGEFVDGKSVPKPSSPKIVDNSTSTEQTKNVESSEFKNLEAFGKLLAKTGGFKENSDYSSSSSSSSGTRIYSAKYGKRDVIIGYFDGSRIYSAKYGKRDVIIGYYEGTRIYSAKYGKRDSIVGELEGDRIYSVKYGKRDGIVGYFEGGYASGAAGAFLLLL